MFSGLMNWVLLVAKAVSLETPAEKVAVPPVMDTVRPMSYPELQEIFGRMPSGLRNYWSGRFLRDLPDELIDLTANHMRPADVYGTILLEPMHGAACRVSPDATAFAGREAKYNATFIGFWQSPGEDARRIETARAYSAALAPWTLGGGYLNYPEMDQSAARVAAAYPPETWARLRQLKRRLDPANRLRFNANIPPADS